MKTEQTWTLVASSGEQQDDISALGEAFALRRFSYVDIAREERFTTILERWPLLAESVAGQQDVTE